MSRTLDVALVREAERLTTGAEIHEVREALRIYKGAVADPNPGPNGATYFQIVTDNLNEIVRKLRVKKFATKGTCR